MTAGGGINEQTPGVWVPPGATGNVTTDHLAFCRPGRKEPPGERQPADRPGGGRGSPGPVHRSPPYPSDRPVAGVSGPQWSPSPGPPGLAIANTTIRNTGTAN